MKKITLLFLALSSLTFAAAYPSGAENINSNQSTTQDTAGININVSAIVTTSTSTKLEIVDENGKQMSAINFYHMLNQDEEKNLTGDLILEQTIYAKAPGLAEATKGKISTNTLTPFESQNFTSNVSTTQSAFDDSVKGVKYTLTSTASATGSIPTGQLIETTPQVLTFTYDKTK